MKKGKLNSIVSMYKQPVLGNVKSKKRFMALTIDKSTLNKKIKLGIAREIISSKGSVDVPGFIDKSKLIIVKSENLLKWKKVCDLKIKGINEVIKNLEKKDKYFIGLEDPDVYNEKGVKHLYFTIPFKLKNKKKYVIYLGHAQGKSLEGLKGTDPLLGPINKDICGFKEIAISPRNFHLSEMGIIKNQNKTEDVSVISLIKSKNLKDNWNFEKIILDPKKLKYNWVMGDLSPCCFLPIQIKRLLVGIINGRAPSKKIRDKLNYGKFRPGLILFNSKTGRIPWVSLEPLFEDPDATTITFASDFVKRGKDKGLLYCHVNDSFVRAYEVDLKELRKYVEKNLKPLTS